MPDTAVSHKPSEFRGFYKSVAAALGSADLATIIQQIDYWLKNENAGYFTRDGHKWIWNGYREWLYQFPWLRTVEAIGRLIRKLERLGIVVTAKVSELMQIGFVLEPEQPFPYHKDDQRKWYRLDYEQLARITGWSPFRSGNAPKSAAGANLQKIQNVSEINPSIHPTETEGCSIKKTKILSKTLSQESETDFCILVKEEVNTSANEEIPVLLSQNTELTSLTDKASETNIQLSQEQQQTHETQFSAAAAVDVVVPQSTLKYVKQENLLKGFKSAKERDDFYQELLSLGRNKSNIHSPVGWAANIIKDINAGGVCEYLTEYRLGVPVGTCEKQEWEIVPGKPLPQFVTYVKRRLRTNQQTNEQALAAAHKLLKDPNAAADLWNSCKRTIEKTSVQWKRDEAMGLSTPYLPPELLPEKEVKLKDAAEAMEQLQSASIQCPAPSPSESSVKTLDEANSDEAVKDEAPELPAAPSFEEVEEKRALLKSGKIGLMMVICWSKAYPGVVELVKDEQGTVIDLKLVESAAPQHERQPMNDDQELEVQEGVVVKDCNCDGQLIDCESESG
jgi:hypothetical protein